MDDDVARIYGVETKRINEAVKNNPDKFPDDYLFEISEREFMDLRSKFSTAKFKNADRFSVKPDLKEKYYIFRELSQDSDHSQRSLAKKLGISLGKVNFILKALIDKGWVKMENFAHHPHKLAYRYILPPEGIREKLLTTRAFITRKEKEYEIAQQELAEARREIKES